MVEMKTEQNNIPEKMWAWRKHRGNMKPVSNAISLHPDLLKYNLPSLFFLLI
jgi:hypothetical protein